MPLYLKARYLAHFCSLSSFVTQAMSARIHYTCMLMTPLSSDDGETVTSSLNRDLDRMKSWADKRKVTFEQSKCKTMTTSRKRNPTRRELFFGSTKLAVKNELEILGVAVDCKLIGTKHVSKSLQERSRSLELDAR